MKMLSKRDQTYFWQISSPYRWLPMLFGLGLGVLLAYLITVQNWLLIFLVLTVAPVVAVFSRYPFAGVITWLVFTPLFVMAPNSEHLMIFWILHRFLIPIVLIVTLLPYLLKLKREWPVQLGPAELAQAAFLGMIILSVILLSYHGGLPLFYKVYDRIFVVYCLYLLIRLTVPGEREFRLLVWATVLIVIFQVTVGLLQNFAPELLPAQWYTHVASVRTIGTFNHPTRYTTVLLFCSLLIFQAAMHWKSATIRWSFLFVFAMAALLIVLSYSKGGWLGSSAGLIGITLLYPKRTLWITIVVIILFLLFGVGLLAHQLDYAIDRLNHDSTNERMVANIAMWRMLETSPFYGWGYGNVDDLISQFVVRLDNFAADENASHNTYLRILAEMGSVGFFLYIFPLIWWFVLTVRAWPRLPKTGFMGRSLVVILWSTILAQFISANTSDYVNGLSGTFAVALWWLGLGLIANLVYPYTTSTLQIGKKV